MRIGRLRTAVLLTLSMFGLAFGVAVPAAAAPSTIGEEERWWAQEAGHTCSTSPGYKSLYNYTEDRKFVSSGDCIAAIRDGDLYDYRPPELIGWQIGPNPHDPTGATCNVHVSWDWFPSWSAPMDFYDGSTYLGQQTIEVPPDGIVRATWDAFPNGGELIVHYGIGHGDGPPKFGPISVTC